MSLSSPNLLTQSQANDVLKSVKKLKSLPESLPQRLFDGAVLDGLEMGTKAFAGLIGSLSAFLQKRELAGTKIEAQAIKDDAHGRVAFFIATTDKPFLVASVTSEISAQSLEADAIIHPIIDVKRDKSGKLAAKGAAVTESVMMIILPAMSATTQKKLTEGLTTTLSHVSQVVSDFEPMRDALMQAAADLPNTNDTLGSQSVSAAREFLHWLHQDNFVLMGVRQYDFTRTVQERGGQIEPVVLEKHNLGLLRDPSLQILRDASEPTQFTKTGKIVLAEQDPVVIAKSNLTSRVHRRVRLDYISVKHFDNDQKVVGETRFIGLFTAAAYNLPPASVPLLREKLENVRSRSGMQPGSHAAKSLDYVLGTYPRDELFQTREDDLLRIATGVVSVLDRPRTRLFVRRDPFDRFVSALVYIPREHYNTELRRRVARVLKSAFDGRISAFYPRYADEPVARVHFIIGLEPFAHPEPDIAELEAEIADLAKPWVRRVTDAIDADDSAVKSDVVNQLAPGFPISFRDRYSGAETLADMAQISKLGETAGDMRVRSWAQAGDDGKLLRAKFYRRDDRLEPSNVMPIMANMKLHVAQETGFAVDMPEGGTAWLHDFEMRLPGESDSRPDGQNFEDAILAVLSGATDNDGFNALIMAHGLSWRDVAALRALCRYRQQSGMDPSEAVQIEALLRHGGIAKALVDLFDIRFNPELFDDMAKRAEASAEKHSEILSQLDQVKSLDHDRVLRRLADTLIHTLRTNFFHRDADGNAPEQISLKISSRELETLPEPRPYREIFVWAPHVEGIHLRFGAVARGGLRWSDRRDDYRTEVLGLVKAQQVKNAVIVPVGSKGGFYPKQLPENGSRDDVIAEGIRAYKSYISALLDITDNYVGEDVVAPDRTVRWDANDPYLVVAADKGTATFSDIANGIAQDKGFWLGDAFASGGSVGYDHKKMGITARGAWEAVKRHFREMGTDIQSEEFDVIGIGDMSGDVFGNGMLLSRHIRLRAAFNHMHIFIDPDPDAEKSFKERERMFGLDRSTWEDYNAKLISKGGGIFPRSAKSVELTDEIREMTGLTEKEVTPNRLIHALLKSKTDLLWFGGIGTYIKSKSESHLDVGDKANDPIRVDATEVQAKVVGEGANLGLTQAGRIELAMRGGRLNTDAVDNSAGVDSSDHEVNIKILLTGAIENGSLKEKDRNDLLASMTDEVASLVLMHNYEQTRALSMAQMGALEDHNAYERFMTLLEQEGRLDRAVEGLPPTMEMGAREAENTGLTRPELAVLLAYAKIRLFDNLIDAGIGDDPYLFKALSAYFPEKLSKYEKAMAGHRLRKEIICTRLANRIVDTCGPLFMQRMVEATNGTVGDIAHAFVVAYDVLEARRLTDEISELDGKIPTKVQYDLLSEMADVIGRVTAWIVRHQETGPLKPRIETRKTKLSGLDKDWLTLLSHFDRKRATGRMKRYKRDGVPENLAEDIALLRSRASGFDVLDFAGILGWPLRETAALFYDVGGRFKIDRMRNAALRLSPKDHWDRLALRRITEDFYAVQGQLARRIAKAHSAGKGKATDSSRQMIEPWLREHAAAVSAYETAYKRLSETGGWTLAKFALATAQLQELARE